MNKRIVIKNAFIQNPQSEISKADISVINGKIEQVSENIQTSANDEIIEAEGLTATPGFIDQHIHGGYGVDFNYASAEDIKELVKQLPKHGITSLVATVMTDNEESLKKQINIISEVIKNQQKNSAQIIGIHLEGPFLNTECKGIHPDKNILAPTIENYLKFDNENVKIVTYAPELDKNYEFLNFLKEKNVILSAGHSKATSEELETVINKGIKQITHVFNAMPPLHHRTPGILGESLINDDISVEVIADNDHLHPKIIDLIIKTKPSDKIIFISDSLPLNRSPQDNVIFGGQKIFRREGKAVNENGTFAGSLSFLDDNLRKNINKIKLADFLTYASLNPAKNLCLNTKGVVAKAFDADIILWDSALNIKKVFINGVTAY
jgi:N-acetylglucosamine-6-phosphate deacetylase